MPNRPPAPQMAYSSQKKKTRANTEIYENQQAQTAPKQVSYFSWRSPVKKDDSIHLYERWQMGQ